MNVVSRSWRRLKLVYLFLLPIRFSLLALAVAAFAFIVSDQGQDIVRGVGEYDPETGAPHWGRILAFLALMNVLGYQIWFWSRQMLRLESPHREEDDAWFGHAPSPQDAEHRGWALWLPRILGALLFVVLFYAFFKVRCTYGNVKTANTSILVLVALSLVLFLFFVVLRRRWLDKRGEDSSIKPVRLRDLARSALVMLVAFLVFELIFFVATSIAPAALLMGFGAGNMVLLTLALWVPFGSVIVYAGIRMRVPILTFLIVLAFLVSPIADRNHIVRTVPTAKTIVDARPTVEQKLIEWHDRVAPDNAVKTPVFIVATEGGGIRAAYWTAVVLDSLQDTVPQFDRNLFGISSVSGGSLGALVFTGLLSENGNDLHRRGSAILGNDFLTPTLAAMTQSDLAQRFLPFGFPDRERALETAWERPSATLAKGLLDLYSQHAGLPSLFVNGTMVETGDRIITSNCRIRSALEFRNAYDGFELLRSDIPLSSAAGMSARFTYVSPAGRIPLQDHAGQIGHVVDGGYFENSGAVTAAELVVLINRMSEANGWNLVPVVILIDYQNCSAKGRECSEDDPNQLGKGLCRDVYGPFPYHGTEGPSIRFNAEQWANEVLSPLRALLNTRGARGEQAVGDARNAQLPVDALPTLVEFRLVQVNVPIPLGWVLSYQSRNAMDGAMETQGNRWSRDQLAGWLKVVAEVDPAATKANEDLKKVMTAPEVKP